MPIHNTEPIKPDDSSVDKSKKKGYPEKIKHQKSVLSSPNRMYLKLCVHCSMFK